MNGIMGICPHCLTSVSLREVTPVYQRLTKTSNINIVYGLCPACAAQCLAGDKDCLLKIAVTCCNNLTHYKHKEQLAVVTDMAIALAGGDFETAFENGSPLPRHTHNALFRGDADYTILHNSSVVIESNEANGGQA